MIQHSVSRAMCALALAALSAGAQSRNDLVTGFRTVPQEAQPRVWWHWMNANITKAGIDKDLDWFKRVGVGGFMNFDGSGFAPRVVEKPLIYMTPEWKDAFRFAMEKADKLGLETAVAASPGWSETGGPWVKPEDAMKKYVWSETWVQGGKRFSGKLAHPPTATGTFQNQKGGGGFGMAATPLPEYYKDTRVFAYRVDAQARSQVDLAPVVTASGLPGQPAAGPEGVRLNAAALSDGDVTNATYVAETSLANPTWVRFEYKQPVTINGISIAANGTFGGWLDVDTGPSLRVEASDDGKAWRPLRESIYNGVQRTLTIPETRARFFRIVFLPAAPQSAVPGFGGFRGGAATTPGAIRHAAPAGQSAAGGLGGIGGMGGFGGGGRGIALCELILRTIPTVNLWEVKANFGQIHDYYAIPTPKEGVAAAVKTSDVVDLTSRMQPGGTLNWNAPAGRWIVVRMGYSLTGQRNGPASAEATGLEVDKLDPKRVAAYMDIYLGMFESATGKDLIGKRGLQNILNDSYEAGYQNWTDDIIEQFKSRRGYDPAPYLPALVGTLVGGPEASDKFLWDWRRTLDEGVAQHYAVIAGKARERGMGTYAEAQEDRRGWFGDDMEMRQYADVPMGASGNLRNFPPGKEGVETYRVDNMGAASVAHIYGRRYVGSEAFTGAPVGSMPEDLKRMADMLALAGVNRYVIHTSVHQPLDSGPGMSLNGIGHFFTRNETWAEQAKPWMEYLGRVSWLLQQGKFVGDVAYFYGQEAPITGIWGRAKQTDVPVGYGYDFVNGDAILNQLAVDASGRLETGSGMSYSLLCLGERARQMTLPVLRKLREFVQGGAAVTGPKPTNSPSLADSDAEFQRIATEMWGSGAPGVHLYGKGRIFVGGTAVQALEEMGIAADYSPGAAGGDIPIGAIHRKVGGGDIYYVVNRRNSRLEMDVSFRAAGKAVELWDPVSGEIREAAYRTQNGRTNVTLGLDSMGSVFVVMLQDGPPTRTVAEKTEVAVARIEGGWSVAFQPDRGAPPSITMPFLASLAEQKDQGVKYFSGTASYAKNITAPADWFQPNAETWLDLGEVHDIARVVVNGKDLGTVWRAPFRVNAAGAIKAGENTVTIEVTNSWFNRLVGDQQDGMKQLTFSQMPGVGAATPLLPAGLVGPVTVVRRN